MGVLDDLGDAFSDFTEWAGDKIDETAENAEIIWDGIVSGDLYDYFASGDAAYDTGATLTHFLTGHDYASEYMLMANLDKVDVVLESLQNIRINTIENAREAVRQAMTELINVKGFEYVTTELPNTYYDAAFDTISDGVAYIGQLLSENVERVVTYQNATPGMKILASVGNLAARFEGGFFGAFEALDDMLVMGIGLVTSGACRFVGQEDAARWCEDTAGGIAAQNVVQDFLDEHAYQIFDDYATIRSDSGTGLAFQIAGSLAAWEFMAGVGYVQMGGGTQNVLNTSVRELARTSIAGNPLGSINITQGTLINARLAGAITFGNSAARRLNEGQSFGQAFAGATAEGAIMGSSMFGLGLVGDNWNAIRNAIGRGNIRGADNALNQMDELYNSSREALSQAEQEAAEAFARYGEESAEFAEASQRLAEARENFALAEQNYIQLGRELSGPIDDALNQMDDLYNSSREALAEAEANAAETFARYGEGSAEFAEASQRLAEAREGFALAEQNYIQLGSELARTGEIASTAGHIAQEVTGSIINTDISQSSVNFANASRDTPLGRLSDYQPPTIPPTNPVTSTEPITDPVPPTETPTNPSGGSTGGSTGGGSTGGGGYYPSGGNTTVTTEPESTIPPTDPVIITEPSTQPTTPTEVPTQAPTEVPTQAPTEVPTQAPTEVPTQAPTQPTTPSTQPNPGPGPSPSPAPSGGNGGGGRYYPSSGNGGEEAPTEAPTEVKLDDLVDDIKRGNKYKIPTSTKIPTTQQTTNKGNGVIPVLAGLSAAAAAGLGAKAYLDRKNNTNNDDDDEFKGEDWSTDSDADIEYKEPTENKEETLDFDNDSYDTYEEQPQEKYDAKTHQELEDLQ